jgi:cardiolipin synthase
MADLHFRLMGPVVTQIERVFLTDWGFVTGEHRTWNSPSVAKAGGALCRTVVDGPNEDLEKLTTILIGAVSLARRRILIMTPYFLPSRELIAALQAAALRGVEVVVILPARSNLPFVDWATRNMLWELLRWNVRVYYQPPPFAHTKLFLVDNHYVLIGSANIDPRSLRLNFELTVEVYEQTLSERLSTYIEAIQAQSREVSLQDMDGRPLPIRVRDALVWLLSPYL